MVSRYRGDPNYAAETKLFTLDGRVVDVLYTASRVGPTSEPGMSLLGVIDITERKQAEEAMRRSEQRYRLLFHNVPFALWQIDAQPLVAMLSQLRAQGVKDLPAYIDDHPDLLADAIGAQKFEEVNDYAVRALRCRDRNELLGTSPWAWLKSVDILRRAVESRWRGEEFYEEATRLETRSGRVIDALFFTARPQTSEGLPITFVGVIDMTKQVRAEEELQRLRADFAHAARISMLGELTASIAHEVNQPLAAIAAGGEASLRWLDRPTPDVNEVRDLTKRVVADARRASEIIARIRAMATRRVPEHTLLSLDELIREALVFLRHEVGSAQCGRLALPRIRAAEGICRPHAATAGDRQSHRQRHPGDGASWQHEPQHQLPHGRPRYRYLALLGRGQWSRYRAAARDAPLRQLLHDQGQRHGHGIAHLPFGH